MKTWSLQNLLFILCISLSATEEIHVSGYEGGEVNVSCPYGKGYESYEKYLCKNNCAADLIRITGAKKNRYSVHDDKVKRVFTVTISHLNRTDAGNYVCGVTRIFFRDLYPAMVTLEVVPAAAFFHPVVFIVPPVLLVVTLALVIIVYKYKCYKVQGAGANMSRNRNEAAETEEVIDVADIYANQDKMRSKQKTSKLQNACQHYDDAEAQQDSVYQNFSTDDDIYCNQSFIRANRR